MTTAEATTTPVGISIHVTVPEGSNADTAFVAALAMVHFREMAIGHFIHREIVDTLNGFDIWEVVFVDPNQQPVADPS